MTIQNAKRKLPRRKNENRRALKIYLSQRRKGAKNGEENKRKKTK
jgi:hypothetical protein